MFENKLLIRFVQGRVKSVKLNEKKAWEVNLKVRKEKRKVEWRPLTKHTPVKPLSKSGVNSIMLG